MDKDYNQKHLEEIRGSEYALDLKGLINYKIGELSNLSTISGTVEEKGVEVQARLLSIKFIKEMFSFLEAPKTKGRPRKNIYM